MGVGLLLKRVEKLRKQLDEKGWKAVLLFSPENRFYFSGFKGSAGVLLVEGESQKLFTDFRYVDQAKEQAQGFKVVQHQQNMIEMVCDTFSNSADEVLALELGALPAEIYLEIQARLPHVKLVDVSAVTNEIRMIKDEQELHFMREAIKICDLAFSHILDFIRPGITEHDIGLELELFMKKHGAERIKANHVIASGPRSCLPHGQATERVIEVGDFVKMDFGAVVNGYFSDFTRTVVVGPPSEKQLEIYQIVRHAQEESLKAIGPGKKCSEIDEVGRGIIRAAGYGDNFGHSLGHSLGLAIHEQPAMRATDDTVLQEGMVITVEPGIYIPGFGGVRIEDLIVITKDGHENFTKSTKDLQVIAVNKGGNGDEKTQETVDMV
jgi:Xaa-Pro aminopeptidase